MSGPKYSEAQLTKIEQARLERERQARLEQMRKELEASKKHYCSELKELNDIERNIIQLIDRIDNEVDPASKIKAKRLLETIELYDKAAIGTKEYLDDKSETLIHLKKELKNKIQEIKAENKENSLAHEMMNIVIDQKKEARNVRVIKQDIFAEFRQLLVETENVYDVLERDRKTINMYREQLEELLEKQDEKDFFEIKQVSQFLNTKLNSAKKDFQSWSYAYDEYLIKAEMANVAKKYFFEFNSIEEIKQECDKLDKVACEQEQMDYIAATIEDVMKQNGHEIVRSDVFSIQNQTFQREYYTFGDDSVLSVTQNAQGAVVMEVSVIGEDEHLSAADRRKAVKKMLSFCGQYPEIIEELNKRGVIFRKKFDTPPDENCASKVSMSTIKAEKQHKNTRRKQLNDKSYKNMQ